MNYGAFISQLFVRSEITTKSKQDFMRSSTELFVRALSL
jgi:hypothetical protein